MSVSPHGDSLVESDGGEPGTVVVGPPKESPVAEPFQQGDRIGRYVLLGKLGEGGMGVVYSAYDPDLNRRVAVKLLRDVGTLSLDSHQEMQALLLREAQAMAQLSHPNVLPIHDVGTVKDRVFIATEYVEGRTLKDWLREDQRRWREIVQTFIAAGTGLAAAHAAGLIHRDFKPSNVLVGRDGKVRVMDFGLARASTQNDDPESSSGKHSGDLLVGNDSVRTETKPTGGVRGVLAENMTMAGTAAGTPPYMAPEQHAGGTVSPAVDQYSFCVALWEGLYGARPFVAADRLALAEAKQAMRMEPVRDGRAPGWLKRILLRGLAPNPADRWPSMELLLHALQRDPVRGAGRIVAGAMIVTMTLSSVVLAYRGAQDPKPCGGAQERVQRVWNAQVRDQVRTSFLSTGRTHAAATAQTFFAMVDEYASQWSTTRTNTCRATVVHREQREDVMNQKMSCLDDSLDQVSAYLRALVESSSAVALDRAAEEFERMASLELCKDAEALARRDSIPIPTGEDQAIEDLGRASRRLIAATAVAAMHQIDAGITKIEGLLPHVTHPPSRAEALFAFQAALNLRGRRAERDRAVEEMRDLAVVYDDKRILSAALISRLWTVIIEERRPEVARELIPVVEAVAILARDEPDADWLHLRLNNTIANFELAVGDLAAAEERFRSIVEDGSWAILNNLAIVLIYRGKSREAREALATAEKALEGRGDLHPGYGTIYLNRGLSYHWQGELFLAEPWYRRAVDLVDRSQGENSERSWMYHLYLGDLLADTGEWEEANREVERAAAGYTKAFGPKSEFAVHARVQKARVALGQGAIASARDQINTALADFEGSGIDRMTRGYTHPRYVDGLVALAEHDWPRAEEAFQETLDVYHRLYESGSLQSVRPLIGLAEVSLGTGDIGRAQETIDEIMNLLNEADSSPHDLRLARTLEIQVRIHALKSAHEKADLQARRALAIWEHTAPKHPQVAVLREFLAKPTKTKP